MISSLKANIENGAEGMFLFIEEKYKHFQRACTDPTFRTDKASLQSFFCHTGGLFNDFYAQMIAGVPGLPPDRRDMAASILNILLAAQDQLTEAEMMAAYEFSKRNFEDYKTYEAMHEETDIFENAQRLCESIIRLREGENGRKTISIVHQSASEFLRDQGSEDSLDPLFKFLALINTKAGHVILAKACLRFLNLREMADIERLSFAKYPFLGYCLINWPLHVLASEERISEYKEELVTFFAPGSSGYREWDTVMRWIMNGMKPVPVLRITSPLSLVLVRYEMANLLDAIVSPTSEQACTLFGQTLDIDATDDSGETALMHSIANKQYQFANRLLDLGANPNITTSNGLTALHLAVNIKPGDENSLDLVRKLVEKGADPDTESMDGDGSYVSGSSLFWGVRRRTELFRLLLDLGAKRYIRTSDQWTILHEAALYPQPAIVKLIVERNLVDVNHLCNDRWTPLSAAAGAGRSLETTKYLVLEQHAKVDVPVPSGASAFYEAAANDNVEIVSFLIDYVSDKNAGYEGWSPLHVAAYNGFIKVVECLLAHGVDKNVVTRAKETPLMFAVAQKHVDIARLLIEGGANLDLTDDDEKTALFKASAGGQGKIVADLLKWRANSMIFSLTFSCLHMAAWIGNLEIVEQLVSARGQSASFDEAVDSSGWTPLLAALRQGHHEVAKFLIESGANINATSSSDWTALHMACFYTQDEDLVSTIVQKIKQEYLTAPTSSGSTPLHLAAENSFIKAIELLIEKEVDPIVYTDYYSTPLYCAAFSGSSKAVDLLLQVKFLPDVQTEAGWTALHAACQKCDGPTVKKLLRVTNWLCRRRSSATPLHIAISNRNSEAIQVLLDAQIPVTLTSSTGYTALHAASETGDVKLVSELLSRGAGLEIYSHMGLLPISSAYHNEDESLLRLLRPPEGIILRMSKFALETCLHDAPRISVSEMEWIVSRGLQAHQRSCINYTPLAAAIDFNRPECVRYLLDQPRVCQGANTKLLFSGWTAAHLAARRCYNSCIRELAGRCTIDFTARDYFGLTPLDYANRDPDSLSSFAFSDPDAYTTWLTNGTGPFPQRQLLVQQICKLISFMLSSKFQDSMPSATKPFHESDKRCAIILLSDALLMLEDREEAPTGCEYLLGRPGPKLPVGIRCDNCRTLIEKTWQTCASCPFQILCSKCRDLTLETKVAGCYKHEFMELPRPSWFNRGVNSVNENDETAEKWLTRLLVKYEALKEPSFDTDGLPELFTDYEDDRPSVHDLCEGSDIQPLLAHLQRYPRDISQRGKDGATVVMRIIKSTDSDDTTLEKLQLLAAAGAELLAIDSNNVSSVQLACNQGYGESLAFLMEQFNPEFDEAKTEFASVAVRMMLDRSWNRALTYTIERHFDWAVQGDFSWLAQLSSSGLTDDKIIALLIESKTQNQPPSDDKILASSWVEFSQPACHERPQVGAHFPKCNHKVLEAILRPSSVPIPISSEFTPEAPAMTETHTRVDYAENEDVEDLYDSDSSVGFLEVTEQAARLCGLAGVFPAFPLGSGIAKFTDSDNSLEVRLSYRSLESSGARATQVLSVLLKAGHGLLQAIKFSQVAHLCCDGFTILHELPSISSREGNPALGLSRISASTIIELVDAIERASKSPDLSQNLDCFLHCNEVAAGILRICGMGYEAKKLKSKNDLQLCSLAMQILCLAFVLFLGAFRSGFHIPTVNTRISRFLLLGLEEGLEVEIKQYKMACVGEMLKDQLFAFSIFSEERSSARQATSEPEAYYVLAELEDILEIWGPAKIITREPVDESAPSQLLVVDICQGQIVLGDSLDNGYARAHWSPKLPRLESISRAFTGGKILLGTLHPNKHCTINMKEVWKKANHGELGDLDTWPDYWALASRSLGLQLTSPYAGASLQKTENFVRGGTKKDSVVNRWNRGFIPVLNKPWGVLFSFSTGFAKRVPLREAIAEVIIPYLAHVDLDVPGNIRLPGNWTEIKENLKKNLAGSAFAPHEMERAKQNFYTYWENLPPEHKPFVRSAISFALLYLAQSGIHEASKRFRISLAENEENPFKVIEFPYSGRNSDWLRLLKDDNHVATFAVATGRCLVSNPKRGLFGYKTSCRCTRQGIVDPCIPPSLQLLQTRVIPDDRTLYETSRWLLDIKVQYLFKRTSITKIMCWLDEHGSGDYLKRILVVESLGNFIATNIAAAVQRRLTTQHAIHESPTTPIDDHIPQDVLICTFEQWERAQNIRP